MKKMFNEGNQIHNFMSSSGSGTVINHGSGSGTVINHGSGSGSDFLTSYGSGYGSGSTSHKVTVPTVPVPQHWLVRIRIRFHNTAFDSSDFDSCSFPLKQFVVVFSSTGFLLIAVFKR
jgi:hypothetical protein